MIGPPEGRTPPPLAMPEAGHRSWATSKLDSVSAEATQDHGPTPTWNGAPGLRVKGGTCSMIAEVVKVGAARFGDMVV